jgi:hypothetical protein
LWRFRRFRAAGFGGAKIIEALPEKNAVGIRRVRSRGKILKYRMISSSGRCALAGRAQDIVNLNN